ncbi:hypothetical protein, partial [Eggerthella lenta]
MLRRHKEASHLSNFTFLSKKWEAVQSGRALFFGRPLAVWQWFYGSREGRRMIYTCHSIG